MIDPDRCEGVSTLKNIGLSAFGVPNIGAVSVFGIGVDNELYFKVWSGAGGNAGILRI